MTTLNNGNGQLTRQERALRRTPPRRTPAVTQNSAPPAGMQPDPRCAAPCTNQGTPPRPFDAGSAASCERALCDGTPRVVNRSISTSATPRELIDRSTTSATHSRVNSSTTLSHFSGRPRAFVSWMKSIAQPDLHTLGADIADSSRMPIHGRVSWRRMCSPRPDGTRASSRRGGWRSRLQLPG